MSVIQKLNSGLGIPGRPRFILDNGQWIDTGCLEWSPSPSIPETLAAISPELKDALERSQEFLQREYTHDAAARLAEFFAREPAHVQAEYAAFTARLQAASPVGEAPAMPELSPALQEAAARIRDRVNREQAAGDGAFDIDRYTARMQELIQAEPPEIQAEYVAYAARVQELQSLGLRAVQQDDLTLRQVRTLVQDDPVTVYRAGDGTIVAAPKSDQFDILRYERTDGANYGLQTADIIERLKVLDAQYGIDIVGAGSANVEFTLRRIPTGQAAEELGRWLLEFCPDLYEAPASFSEGEIALWWD